MRLTKLLIMPIQFLSWLSRIHFLEEIKENYDDFECAGDRLSANNWVTFAHVWKREWEAILFLFTDKEIAGRFERGLIQ